MIEDFKSVTIRCDCRAENLVFSRFDWLGMPSFEFSIEDAYCSNNEYKGFFGRIKRVWKALIGKPIVYNSVCIDDIDRIKKFIEDCNNLINE